MSHAGTVGRIASFRAGRGVALITAAMFEIVACLASWAWLDGYGGWGVALVGLLAVGGFAAMLTRGDRVAAGNASAAYALIYLVTSLVWIWGIDGRQLAGIDVVGVIRGVLILALVRAGG